MRHEPQSGTAERVVPDFCYATLFDVGETVLLRRRQERDIEENGLA